MIDDDMRLNAIEQALPRDKITRALRDLDHANEFNTTHAKSMAIIIPIVVLLAFSILIMLCFM